MKHFTRLSWNSNGWQHPSGIANKCKGAGNNRLYECLHGFGWEEWLFHYIEHKDGYCYGFLQCFNNKNKKHKIIKELHLYTRKCIGACKPNAKADFLYVGEINDLEVLGKEHVTIVNSVISANEKMMKETLDDAEIKNYDSEFNILKKNGKIFNVRFKRSNVKIPKGPVENRSIKLPHGLYRFNLYDITKRTQFINQIKKY